MPSRISSKAKLVLLVAISVFLLDHLTKFLIVQNMALGDVLPVLPGYFDIVHTRNTGAAFGMLHEWNHAYKDLVFYVIGFCAFLFLVQFVRSTPQKDRVSLVALSGIMGGAWGNILDRALRGSVVDFLSAHWGNEIVDFSAFGTEYHLSLYWPAFNVADAAIVCGVVLLLWRSIRPFKEA